MNEDYRSAVRFPEKVKTTPSSSSLGSAKVFVDLANSLEDDNQKAKNKKK